MDKPQLPKMLKKLYLYLLLLCSLAGFRSYAQTFPISVTTQITQPSPIYLTKYADAATINSPIKIQLTLNDLTISNRQVRLKIYFQGNGISFNTNDFVVGAKPLYLEGGFPLQLTNVDLAPYFEYQNLLGVNQNQYAQPLPEGIYNIYVEVYDFATGKKLSKKTGSTTIIFQNEPPFLNLPLNNASIMQQNIQNIVFSWTPRSINVSNVEYEFSLVEIWDNYTPVQNAFAYSPPLYTTTTKMTTLQYGINEPQLIPGKKYAWRIKAKAILGAEEIGVFKNNGYTEIFAFTYEMFCTAPLAITTSGVSQDQAKITWSGNIDNFDYQVNYREKNAGSEWYKAVTPRENITLSNLKPNTTYEYTIGSSCDVGKYIHSTINEFTTIAKDEIAFAGCGIKPDPNDLANKTPLPNLYPNDVVTAGDFPIVVSKATGSNGSFTGEGYVTLPFLEKFKKLIDAADAFGGDKTNIGKFSRIRITFNNIGVNTDFKLISGEIVASYDPAWTGVGDLDGVVNDAFGDAGNVVNHQYDLSIKSVVKNPDGTITVTSTTGVTSVIDKTVNDIIITDKDGKQFTVPANATAGNIEQTGQLAPGGIPTPKNTNGMGSGGDVAEISSADVKVTFSQGDGKYSFDTAPLADNGSLGKTYQAIPQKNGGTYKVNYKAISDSPNSTDVVVATVDFKNGKTKKDLVFKTQNGTAIDSTKIVWKDNVATLTLKKTLDFAKETIIATVKPVTPKDPKETNSKYDIAGTIDLWHLTNKKVNVTLVSVNNATIPNDAQKQLNAIYEPAGITFEVNTINVSLDNSWGDSIETSDSDLLNTYTPEQQQITANLKTQLGSNYKKDTYYVIYTDAPSNKSNLLGFMPLKRQYGFIFNKNNTVRTLAHELGHGVFGLQHPFTQYNTSSTTDLLMDYGTGVVLSHNDWQVLHAPGLQLYPFIQGDSDGENREANELDLLGNIFKVTENEEASGNILVGKVSQNTPYLITGFNVYQKETKKRLAAFDGKVVGNEVIYELTYKDPDYNRVSNLGDKMPYPVILSSTGKAVIKISNDKCTYSYKNILNWTKPKNATTDSVIEEIKKYLAKDNTFITVPLYAPDPTCSVINSIADLITNDTNKCQPDIIAIDKKKLETLFAKKTFTNEDLVNLIVKQHVCIAALREVTWDNLKKAFTQLSLSPEIKNDQEIAILRVMVAIDSKNLNNFYDLISLNNHEIIINLNKHLNDHSINPYDTKNYTSFYQGLMAMFSVNSTNIERLIPLDKTESYKFIKNLVPEAVTGFDESYYYEYITNNAVSDKFKMVPVFWNSLSYTKRMGLIKDAMSNNSAFDKSEEILLNLLIHEKDAQKITVELQNDNYALLWAAYKVLDGKERKYFVQDILYKTLLYKKIPSDYANNLAAEIRNKYNTIPPLTGIRTEPYFMFYDKGIFNVVSNDGAVLEYNLLVTRSMADNSRIQFNCSMQVINSKDQRDPVQHLFTLAPYEYVVLEIPKDFKVDGRDFKKGLFAVPAIYAYWIANAVEDHNDAVLFRLVADGVAVALAPFTSGGSLLVLELAMVSTDIIITVTNYNNPDAISPKYNAYWDAIYGIYNLPKAVAGLSSLGTGIFQFAIKEGKYIQSVKIIRSNIKNFVSDFKDLNEAERLAHLNKIDNLLETLSNGIKGGTLNPNEIRVSKKMYDMILEARIKCQNINQNLSSIIDITVDNSGLLLNNGVTASQKIADISISQNTVNLSNVKWLPASVTDVKIINTFDKISYINKSGETANGVIEVVEDIKNKGLFYANISEETKGLLNYPNIRKYLGDGSTKALLNNNEEINEITNLIRHANTNVLDQLNKLQDVDFFMCLNACKENKLNFIEALKSESKFSSWYNKVSNDAVLRIAKSEKIQESVKILKELRIQNKLDDIGNITDLELAAIHQYTAWGNFLNDPMRKDLFFGEYATGAYKAVTQGLDKLRNISGRKVVNERVYSGRAYSLEDFNNTFLNGKGTEVAIKGFVSSTKNKEVAIHFAEKTMKYVKTKEKVKVIRRITSKEGVYIDDISDWGRNLGRKNHYENPPIEQVQEEVLMNEGYFRQTDNPIPVLDNNGNQIFDADGKTPWYYVDFVELVKPIR